MFIECKAKKIKDLLSMDDLHRITVSFSDPEELLSLTHYRTDYLKTAMRWSKL